jgi:3-methyladenine DNA glycosylase AlkC
MSGLLKHMYNPAFFDGLIAILDEVLPGFGREDFLYYIFTPAWETLELKARMQHISRALAVFLPVDFPRAVPYLIAIKEKAQQANFAHGFAFMFLPDYVEQYGLSYFEPSVEVLQQLTSLASAEFAVRPLLIKYPRQMLHTMVAWSTHPDLHVRRLASEGCRPRLPWAMGIPFLKKDPSLVLPILENLKADPSDYVRRSVANNLNDISKDHPQLAAQIASQWKGQNRYTDKLLKHACRTLLKSGHLQTLQLFGFGTEESVEVYPLIIDKESLHLNEWLTFTFSCTARRAAEIRLQYIINFARQHGKTSKKAFFLAEKKLAAGEKYTISKKLKLQNYTTRTLYQGQHTISIMLNGEIKTKADFYLYIP